MYIIQAKCDKEVCICTWKSCVFLLYIDFSIQVKKSKIGSSKNREKNGERRMENEEWTEKVTIS